MDLNYTLTKILKIHLLYIFRKLWRTHQILTKCLYALLMSSAVARFAIPRISYGLVWSGDDTTKAKKKTALNNNKINFIFLLILTSFNIFLVYKKQWCRHEYRYLNIGKRTKINDYEYIYINTFCSIHTRTLLSLRDVLILVSPIAFTHICIYIFISHSKNR